MSVKLMHTYHLNLLVSYSDSSNGKNVSLTDWSLHVAYDGAVTVIQEFDANLCTPLLVPDTPTLSATSPVRASTQVV